MLTFSQSEGGEGEKGLGVQNQLRIWDSLLEIRIQLQKLLVQSNDLPPFGAFNEVIKASAAKEGEEFQLTEAIQNSRLAIKDLLENFLQLQNLLTLENVQKGKRKSSGEDLDEEITSEDEIDEEEEGNDKMGKVSKVNGEDDVDFGDSAEKDDEMGDKDDENDSVSDDDEDGEPVKSKKRKLKDYEKLISKNFGDSILLRKEIIQKWNDKTQVSSGKVNKSNFSAFQVSTLKQIDHILSNKERLLKKTQISRSQDVKATMDEEGEMNPEVFNDDDFFHQLLRELIENSASTTGTPSELSRHYLELQKLRTKLKRKIDTKASKGRKIRYDVHSKLANFMAPYEYKNSMSESAKTELYKSIFKNVHEWNA